MSEESKAEEILFNITAIEVGSRNYVAICEMLSMEFTKFLVKFSTQQNAKLIQENQELKAEIRRWSKQHGGLMDEWQELKDELDRLKKLRNQDAINSGKAEAKTISDLQKERERVKELEEGLNEYWSFHEHSYVIESEALLSKEYQKAHNKAWELLNKDNDMS